MANDRSTKSPRSPAKGRPKGVAAGRVEDGLRPGPEHRVLDALIGRWLTEGHTVAGAGAAALPILASDVYEWAPGGFFIHHTAYGRVGAFDVGGTEIIGYDPESEIYRVHFFDSLGNATAHTLSVRDSVWTWQGERTRCTGRFSEGGRVMTAHHERSDDGVKWEPSMVVTLRRVG
jgi:hypothetical protein